MAAQSFSSIILIAFKLINLYLLFFAQNQISISKLSSFIKLAYLPKILNHHFQILKYLTLKLRLGNCNSWFLISLKLDIVA